MQGRVTGPPIPAKGWCLPRTGGLFQSWYAILEPNNVPEWDTNLSRPALSYPTRCLFLLLDQWVECGLGAA